MIIMGKNKNFRKEWRTLTELGQEFGMSAVKFGNLLKQHELREKSGEPSQAAHEDGFVQKISPKDGKPYFLWHHKRDFDRGWSFAKQMAPVKGDRTDLPNLLPPLLRPPVLPGGAD